MNDIEASQREMFEEITALMGGLIKAFNLSESDAIAAIEAGSIEMSFDTDNNGNRFVLACYEGKTARLYAGAIKSENTKEH